MSHKRTLITSIIFLIVILFAILIIGPKSLAESKQYFIDAGDEKQIEPSYDYKCLCINKKTQEIRFYKYAANNDFESESLCHTRICEEMFGSGFYALESKSLNKA